MFKLNLKIAWRNILKNKVYTLVNVVGLALGLAGFIFILMYVNFERGYDHWDPQLNEVYQVQELDHWAIKDGEKQWMAEADRRLKNVLETSISEISEITFLYKLSLAQSVKIENSAPFLVNEITFAEKNFFNLFPFKFVYGDLATALEKPKSIVIKEAFALKHFGNINPIGKTISINQQNWTQPGEFTVTGVIAEPKTASTVDFEILTSSNLPPPRDMSYSFVEMYAKILPDVNLEQLNESVQKVYAPFKSSLLKRQGFTIDEFKVKGIHPSVRMMPIQQVHQQPLEGKSWHQKLKPVFLLSVLLLAISIINFINMFTAQAVSRAKEVGVKKVIGANRVGLVKQFLVEIGVQCACALLLGIILLEGFLPYLNGDFNLNLSLKISADNVLILFQLVLLLIVVTLIAGLYPSFFLSSYKPQLVLMGNFLNSKKGKFWRNTLVGLQFVIAVGFFIGSMIITRQITYMNEKDPGFNPKSTLHLRILYDKLFAEQLKRVDGVKYVGSNNGMISRNSRLSGIYKFGSESRELSTVLVNYEGLQALEVKLLKGRLFDSKMAQDSVGSLILNESLEKQYGGDMVGKFIYVNDTVPNQVIGVIKDIQVGGFDQFILPTVYTAAHVNATGYNNTGVNYVIKYDSDKENSVLSGIKELWQKHFPNYPFTHTMVADDLALTLTEHLRFQKMLRIFSFMVISLSLIGLFSLASYLTKQRTKELAVRKILGASNVHLLLILNKGFLWMMFAANIVAWPLIYIAANYWLQSFAYRIEMPVLPFLVGLVISLIATFITVSIQAYNAVKANPSKALKYE